MIRGGWLSRILSSAHVTQFQQYTDHCYQYLRTILPSKMSYEHSFPFQWALGPTGEMNGRVRPENWFQTLKLRVEESSSLWSLFLHSWEGDAPSTVAKLGLYLGIMLYWVPSPGSVLMMGDGRAANVSLQILMSFAVMCIGSFASNPIQLFASDSELTTVHWGKTLL